jgi:hypothetical protein
MATFAIRSRRKQDDRRSTVVGPLQRSALYAVFVLLWLSGTYWLYFAYLAPIRDSFGAGSHPAQPFLLEVHGAAAMAFLVVFGTFLPTHVAPGWRQRRHRLSGLSLVAASAVLVLSGWGLYYIGAETLRNATSILHSFIGVVAPLLLVAHVRATRRKRSAQEPRGAGFHPSRSGYGENAGPGALVASGQSGEAPTSRRLEAS